MLRDHAALYLALIVPLPLAAQEPSSTLRDQLDRPYVALFEASSHRYVSDELKSLQSAIEQEQKEQLEACRKDEKRLKAELDRDRKGLRN